MATRPGMALTECALADLGCGRASEYAVIGPVYGPASMRPVPDEAVAGGGWIAQAFPCAEHLAEVSEWFHEPEVLTIHEYDLGHDELFGDILAGLEVRTFRAKAASGA